jgi:alpha-beta hydrolase superfamily lysophospholipase
MPSRATLREVPLNTLPSDEAERLIELMVPDSGRVFRAMTFGLPSMRLRRGTVDCPVLCVSGGADRNVSNTISRRIAARYGAEHQVWPEAPHWIVAESLADEIAPPVLDWLQGMLASA